MMLLCALIFRAVSIEFRSKKHHPLWRQAWDVSFCMSSTMAAFLFGAIVGNLFIGLPIGANQEFHGTIKDHFNSYTILTGLFAVAACAMHGSIYLYLKTEGELQKRVHGWMWQTFGIFLVFYILTTMYTLAKIPTATANFTKWPWAVCSCGFECIGDRQHSSSDPLKSPRLCIHFIDLHAGSLYIFIRRGHVSKSFSIKRQYRL